GSMYSNYPAGSAMIFTRTNGAWSQQGGQLTGNAAYLGSAVGMSGDGNTVIVGGYDDNLGLGAALIFVRSNGSWLQQGNKLVGTGAVGESWQGFSVSLSADGNTAIVGGSQDKTGAAWIYTWTNGLWSQVSKLVAAGYAGQSATGSAVSISADGNTA